MYIWIKAFHIIAVICWFAALLYLPRLFVYHSQTKDTEGKERFKVMERKLYHGIMTPSMAITIILGIYLASRLGFAGGWLHIKMLLVAGLVWYHLYCGKLMKSFAKDENRHGHVFYRWFNELPAVLLIIIVVLAVVKPI
jgi:putative membrane protein